MAAVFSDGIRIGTLYLTGFYYLCGMVSLWSIFVAFAKIGSFTIGGGYAMIPHPGRNDKTEMDP